MTRLGAPVITVVALLLTSGTSQAAVVLTDDDEVIVPSHQVIEDDLIVYAPYVRVDGVVKGDLVALGEEVVVEGIVEGDLIAAGKTVYLNGAVNDDARLLAYALALGENAKVADDLFAVSYSLETKAGSRIGGTLYTASRQVLLAGQVAENALVRAGALLLRGITGGDVRAIVGGLEGFAHSSLIIDLALEIPALPEGITVAQGAAIGGDLDYRSLRPAVIEPGAQIVGETRHEAWQLASSGPIQLSPLDDRDDSSFGAGAQGAVERLAAMLIVGLVLALAAPRWLHETADNAWSEPLGAFGWGLVAVIFTGLLSVILGIAFLILFVLALSTDFGGFALTSIIAGTLAESALGTVFLLALLYLAPVLASAGIGLAILERIRPSVGDPVEAPGKPLRFVTIGVVIYAIVRAIPWLGPPFGFVATLIGLGALTIWLRDRFEYR